MRRLGIFAALTIAALVAVGLTTGVTVYAAGGSQVTQGSADHSVYKVGDTVLVTGTINGDVFCVGQTVTIDATVNGDVLCTGQSVTVSGRVNGNVRLAGQDVNLSAVVTRGAAMAGQSVTVESAAQVGQDASLAAQSATIDGTVGRDLNGTAGMMTLGGRVGRNADLRVDNVTLGSTAAVADNLTYTSPNTLHRTAGAQVLGTIIHHKAAVHNRAGTGAFIWFEVYWLAAIVVLGVVLEALFPRLFWGWNPVYGAGFWWSLLVGFVAMFVVPVVIAALLATVIGAPLGILLLLLWLAAALLAMPLAAYFIGSLAVSNLHPVLRILVGGIILGVVELIPVIGWIVGLIAYWVGSGILLRGIKRSYRRPVYDR